MAFRIAIGGIEHESSSFIPDGTPLDVFYRNELRGDCLAGLGSANTVIDGLVGGVRDCGAEVVPLSWTTGGSGGLPSHQTYHTLVKDFCRLLRQAIPVDAVLLSLHGAFAAEGVDDADGDIIESVREIVGPSVPVIAVHDLHSNISEKMVRCADLLIVEQTYPHTDMAERGRQAAIMALRMLRGEVCPTQAMRSIPILWSAPKMITALPPMSEAIAQLADLERLSGVLSASLAVGYQWVDSPIVGATAVVATDGDFSKAQRCADSLAAWVWERRADWRADPLTPEQALALGEEVGRYPIVLADQADNTGGGTPGDSTEILRLFMEKDLQDAAVLYVVDPEAASAARQAGRGATLRIGVGGRSHPLLGPPVPMEAEVVALSDGRFVYDGPMWRGVEACVGNSALLRQRGVYVVVTSEREQPIDLAFSRSLGLNCRGLRYISVKSTGHFRSGFGPIAGSIYNVDAAGLLTHDFSRLPYRRLGREVYPIDPGALLPLG